MASNVVELFPNQVDMSRFKNKDFKVGIGKFEAIDPSKETNELGQAISDLSDSFESKKKEKIKQDKQEQKYLMGNFDVYNVNAIIVTYYLECGEKINKKI